MFARAVACRWFAWFVALLAGIALPTASVLAAEEGATNLPLKRVVLFSSGVGYYQHDGQVTGDAKVEMQFKIDNINDLLKSMVVQDFGGGQVSTVNYGSKDPLTKTLKSFAIDLTTNPTLADLLNQARGQQVEVEAPNKLVGTILGVEKHKKEIDKGHFVEAETLNLLTADGLRAVPLETVSRIKLTSPTLDAELHKALALLAESHALDKKAVSLRFLGQGKRDVRVGYIQESPVWKTSYRLVLSDKKAPFLQGWAIVENTTEEDWSGVNLTLVSGRPISFTMDLYEPLYVARPQVQMELYASLRPQVYNEDLAQQQQRFHALARPMAKAKAGGMVMVGMSAPPALAAPAMASPPGMGGMGAGVAYDRAQQEQLRLDEGVQSAAQAGEVGELFQYVIAMPVSLPRQQSAMLPIVNEDVKCEKVSIYNEQVQAKHPLNGLQLTNSTKLHLMQGPITVFDGDVYAGDAKIEDLAPGGERLLSYAMDLDTEVAPESKAQPEQLVSVRLVKGTMIVVNKAVRTRDYTVKNSGRKDKKVLVEYPLDGDWKLVAPEKPAEKTRDRYRFVVEAKPGEPAKLHVEEEQTLTQYVGLSNIDDSAIDLYLRAKVVSQQVKSALGEIIRRKVELNNLTQKRQQLETRIREIGDEQSRIRQNMTTLDHASDLYKRYVKKFSDQEDEVEKLRTQAAEAQSQENAQHKALDEYLMALDLS